MKEITYSTHPEIKEDISPLYLSSFPASERPPLRYFYQGLEKNKENELYAYYDDDVFIGFSYLTSYKDIIYIFFLAVKESLRNKGYGSKILTIIKDNNPDKVILLCYEEVDTKYKDYLSRKKRKDFYIKNGFKKNGLKTDEYGVIFETAYIGKHPVSFQDYEQIFIVGFGKGREKHLKEVKED
ncbi:MAG: GNAT family N-acetyltransferase [Bacilli bacterium]|nr:GNAT family N-acetyltransferase [Bacilli bacterium]